jgi:polysaccharide biosynthesis/export protein
MHSAFLIISYTDTTCRIRIMLNAMTAKYTSFFLLLLIAVFQLFSPASSLSEGKDYTIGPRDIITVSIFAGGEKQQEVDLTVSGQGTINVPFIGSLKAEGLTIPELESAITKPLAAEYFVDPAVNIQVKEYHNLQYYISGAVRDPGLYETSSNVSLMELIAKAGGALPERGNVAYILRASSGNIANGEDIENLISYKDPLKVDLKDLMDKGDMTHNILLQSGDVVYIPLEKALNLAESNIYVEGEVAKPGVYSFQTGLTALNACIIAGGFNEFAAPNRTTIIRKKEGKQEVIKVDLNQVKEGKTQDIELEPGDRIHIPETWF